MIVVGKSNDVGELLLQYRELLSIAIILADVPIYGAKY